MHIGRGQIEAGFERADVILDRIYATPLTEHAFLHREAPPVRVTGWDTPFPLTHEREYLPLAHRIAPVFLETARY